MAKRSPRPLATPLRWLRTPTTPTSCAPMTLILHTVGTRHPSRVRAAIEGASHVFSLVEPTAEMAVHPNLVITEVELPDPTDRRPWQSEQLGAFKMFALRVLTVCNPNVDRKVVITCRAGKNRSRAVRKAVALAIGRPDLQGPEPADPLMAELATKVFTHDYEALTRWPPERPRSKRSLSREDPIMPRS